MFPLCCLLLLVSGCSAVVIRTQSGDIRGLVTTFEFDGQKPISIFRGIPFAKPPLGELRYAKPERVSPWEGEKDATQFGNECMQVSLFPSASIQSEDCLYLNVFVPGNLSEPVSDKKAVMVFIHGGGFIYGTANGYDATGLVALSDVIVVAMNYRLGPFGFLHSGGVSPSNLGLLDQHLALEWVRDNIEEFGGDSGNITIFGESAGSMSVGYHLMSPLSDSKLFQRGILQSGGTILYNFFTKGDNAISLAKQLLCDASTNEEALKCLRSKSAAEINKVMEGPVFPTTYVPAIDEYFIPYNPIEILTNFSLYGADSVMNSVGNLADYDIIAGYNGQEGLGIFGYDPYLVGNNWTDGMGSDLYLRGIETMFKAFLPNNDTRSVIAIMAAAQYAQPFEGSSDLTLAQKRLRWYTDIAGDHQLSWPTLEVALLHSQIAPVKKTYFYLFDHKRSTENILWNEGPSWLRTSADHYDDIAYVFYKTTTNYTSEEDEMAQAMVSYWTNFAKSGDPQSQQKVSRGGTQWPELSEPDRQYLRITTSADKKEQGPLGAKAQFWRSVVIAAYTNDYTPMADPSCGSGNIVIISLLVVSLATHSCFVF